MSDVVQEGGPVDLGGAGAPAVAANDPAAVSGPGVTQNPDNAGAVFDLASVAEENAKLRAQLITEHDALKAALADARAAGVTAQGLTDEEVRRIEHPEEFIGEYAALGEHEALVSQVGSLQQRLDQVNRFIAGQAQPAATAAPGSAAVTADPLADPSQTTVTTPDGTRAAGPAATVDGAPAVVGDTQADPFAGLSDQQIADELSRRETAGSAS